jgi:hypothetical protein
MFMNLETITKSNVSRHQYDVQITNHMKNLQKIDFDLSKGVCSKCPKCGLAVLAVFHTWKPTGKVSVRFHHVKVRRSCSKTYLY